MSRRNKSKPRSPKLQEKIDQKNALRDQEIFKSIRQDIDRIVAMIDNTMYSDFYKSSQKKSPISLHLLSKYSL